MFVYGILAILQILFLPGLIIYKKAGIKGSVIQNLSVIIGASLLSNYLGVLILTVLNIYTRAVAFVIVGVELIFLFQFYRSALLCTLSECIARIIESIIQQGRIFIRYFSQPEDEKEKLYRFFYTLFFIFAAFLAFIGLWWSIKLLAYNLGTVFTKWDAVVSWNKWAVIWSQQKTLYGVSAYPQMMPTNWSLTYLFMGNTEVQFFAKAIVPIFMALILLMLTDLAFQKKEAGYLLAVLFVYLMSKKLLGAWLTAGYSDIPLAYFTLLSVYILLIREEKTERQELQKTAFFGMTFAAAAAVTKQAGIYVVVIYPLLFYFAILRPIYGYNFKKIFQLLWKPILLAIIIVAPWYIYRQFVFMSGTDIPELPHILDVTKNAHKTAAIKEQIFGALSQLGKYLVLLIALLPFLLILDPINQAVVLLIAFPFTLLWAVIASYDARNLALAIPLIGMTAGVGFGKLTSLSIKTLIRIKAHRIKTIVLPILFLIALFAGSYHWKNETLLNKQIEEQKQLFSPEKNQMLLNYIDQNPGAVNKILTYYPLDYIPGLAEYKIHDKFDNFSIFEAKIQDETVTHILIPKSATPEIEAYVEEKIQTGEYELIFENSQWVSYRFIRIR